ncbi:Putative large exoprotein involved in heme utilization or adhesion of ShlA/HecA/FhaA family [Serratia rubidaea]|uniref:hemagglutinin repeat-containing protein n=1 Tax=Serratia rubidaea TaxID=61652 RepID=UPI00078AF86E|nr:hemagglutinin repeat-containing protein [Serratia rubidaea]AML59001.1 Putative large exoprotein involved in heme utilization or adhesion of ShlA/HecA/FhaA family [Serratia rubidaea]
MNKHCYRLIFSRTHGELRVVSELARSCSSEPGQSRGGHAPRLWVTVRRAVWLLGLALFAGPALAGGIVADGPAGQRPEVIATQNGLPQINITAPNQAGVSHNKYKQFDVDRQGAILNNSATMTSTQLGGMIQGNPNLNPNGAPARVILNEVNSNNPSQLRGFLEVAGGRAQVIVANPAGIVCNGCGTINAGRMTLTTGKPQLNADGSLGGYQVERGMVRIEGGGLNGDARHDTEYVDILARAVEVNAGVWAKQGLKVVAGRNRVSADGNAVTPLAADDKKPALAIDMGQMGGMYSGHIQMIGTEAGVGVRNQGGHLQAGKTLTVSSEGKLSWQPAKQEAVTQAGGDIQLAARDDIDYHGKLHSGGTLSVQSRDGELRQSGTLAAAGDVRLNAARGIRSSGNLLAGSDVNSQLVREADLTLASQGEVQASGKLLSKKTLKVSGRQADLSQATLSARRTEVSAAAGGVALRQATLDSRELALSATGDIDAQQARINAGRWDVSGNSLFGQGAIWSQSGDGDSRFALNGILDNSDGSIEARGLQLDTVSLNNQRGRLVALDGAAQRWRVGGLLDNRGGVLGGNGSLTLTAGELHNQSGVVQSQSALDLRSAAGIDNDRGQLLAGRQLTLNAGGALTNRDGDINGTGLQLAAHSLDNAQGRLVSQSGLQLTAHTGLDNRQGLLEAGDELTINSAGDWDNRGGRATGGRRATVTARQINNDGGRLQSGGALTLNSAGNVSNQGGLLTAQQGLSWQGAAGSRLNNDGGKVLSDGALSLQGGSLSNRQQGRVQSRQALTLALDGGWDNRDGTLQGGGATRVRADSLLNAGGAVQSLDALDMQFTRQLDNGDGKIFSKLSQTLRAEDLLNHQGWMGSQGGWSAVARHFDNRGGSVQSQQDAQLASAGLDNQGGSIQSAGALALHIAQDVDNRGGKLSAQGRLALRGANAGEAAGTLHNAAGQLLAGDALSVAAQSLDNQQGGLLYSQRAMRLNLNGALDNRRGRLQSGERLQLDAQSLLNEGGALDGQQQVALRILGLLDNTRGAIRSNGAQQVSAQQVENREGVFSSRGSLALSAGRLDNLNGTLIGQGDGDYRIDTLNNQQGKIHSGQALTLRGQQLNNQGGQLVSTGAQRLEVAQIDNRGGTVTSQDRLSLQSSGLNNRDGGLLMGTTHTDVSAQTLDNGGGRLQSAGSLTLSLLDTLNNQQGRIVANGALAINGQQRAVSALQLLNQGGLIQSGATLAVDAGTLDNQGGTLLSQQALTLSLQQDYTQRAGDTLSSNEALTLTLAGGLTNLTQWLLPGSLTVNGTHITNLGSLVGKTLRLTTGALLNKGRLEADSMTVDADTLDNLATVMGDDITLRAKTIDNHGRDAVIAATERLHLQAGERLTNRDGSLIYSAGSLHLGSGDLIENRASNIEADGDLTVEAKRLDNLREGLEIEREAESSDYKWHRYNYYWRSYGSRVNPDKETMAPTTQNLTFRDDAAADSNPYGTLLAIDPAGKRAQVRVKSAQGEMLEVWVNYLALKPNDDGGYAMTFYETRGFRQNSVPTPYHNTVWREHDRGRLEQWDPEKHLDIINAPFVTDYSNFRERTTTGTVTRDRLVSAGIGGQILAGGNMVLRIASQLLNDASTLAANGNLTIDGDSKVINRGYSVNERRQEYIVDHYDKDTHHWYPTFNRDETTALTTIDGIISGNGSVAIRGASIENTTVNQAQIGSVAAAQQAAEAERAELERNPLAVTVDGVAWQSGDTQLTPGGRPLTPGELALTDKQHLGDVATAIPDNGLFRQHLEADSPYLVVTDERFTSRSKFISSDYMLQRVGYDPAQVHKRLGDGFYEQRLVREQMLKLTGRPSVRGEDAMAQYQRLMNNGIKVAQDFQLVPGVALRPEQIAALTQDIVWLVSETVQTAHGPQTVWVPKVYLANDTLRLNGDGALIAGGELQLSAGSIHNAGNLFADKALTIDAGQFMHQSGDIRADSINVQADSLTMSTNLQDALRQASMSANDISLSGGDIRLQGAKLDATQNLSLSARNNLEIGAARSSHTADLQVISGAMGNRTSGGMEEAGSRMAQVSGEWQQAQGSTLSAGNNLTLKAGRDITLQGSQAKAGGQLGVQAGGDVKLLAESTTSSTQLTANSRTSSVNNSREEERLQLSTLSGDQGVTLTAGNNLLAEGAQVDSQEGRIGLSGQNVTLKEARQQVNDRDSENKRVGKTKSRREEESARSDAVGSTFSGQSGVTVVAREGDVTVTGSTLHSEDGAIALQAKNDVTLSSATESEATYSEERSEKKKRFWRKQSSRTVKDDRVTREKGSLLSGDSVSISAGNDLTVSGSAIAADHDVNLQAGNNVDISAATETDAHYLLEEKKKKGLLSGGGLGFTIGSQSSRHQIDEKGTTQSQSVSTVGSNQGNVTISAGKQLHIGGADLVAGKDMTLSGDSVQIDPGYDQRTRTETFETRQSGLSVALSGAVGSALNTAVSTAQQARKESSGRLQALQGTKAALSGVQAMQANERVGLEDGEKGSGFAVSVSLGSQKSSSTQKQEQSMASGSTLNAGNNLTVTATGKHGEAGSGDIAIGGSQLKAGGDVTLDAQRDLLLSGAANMQKTEGSNKSSGGSVGMSLGVGKNSGLSIFANANSSKGSEHGDGTRWNETTIDSGNKVTLHSGRDTTLKGAQVSGEQVSADVGRNLTLQSQQDSDRYDAKQTSVSGGVSVPIGAGSGSVNLSASRDKLHSNYDSVQEQTGIFAGKGGFDVKVGEHTQLDGAVLASTADKEKNRLETGTLGWSDIHNKADFKAEHSGGSLSTGGPVGKDLLTNMAGGMLSGANNSGHAQGTSKAAVSEGTIAIREQDKQQQDVAELSRDTENANGSIGPIFDKEKEQNRLREAQLIGEIGGMAMDVISTQGDLIGLKAAKVKHPGWSADKLRETKEYQTAMKEYGTGSDLHKAAQALTGALTALAGNNLAGALASGASPYLATEIKKLTTNQQTGEVNVAANAMAHAVLGAVTAQLNNQSAVAGGLGAGGGELAARYIAGQLFPGKKVSELSENERQQVSALSQLAAGLAGGLVTGDTAGGVTAAQTGKNAVENNFLGATSSDKLDKAVEKIKNGDKTLAIANELIKLENADKRSDALVSKFTKDPSEMSSTERAELAGYLRVYASEMEKEYGSAVSQELVKGLLSGQDYVKRNPDSEAMSKAQSIMNTWGYHKSNASIGDAPLIFGSSVLGLTVKGMAANAAIGAGVNAGVQLAGKDPFSYVDTIMAGVTAAATTGKGLGASVGINVGGAAIGSGIKGENPINSTIGAGLGSVAGGVAGKIASELTKPIVKETTSKVSESAIGAITSEVTGNKVKEKLEREGKK